MRFSTSIEVLIIFVTTILAPLLITITGNVISEWIVRKWLDKRDKKIGSIIFVVGKSPIDIMEPILL